MVWPVRGGVTARVAGAVVWLVSSALIVTGTANIEPDAVERPVDVLAYAVVSLACVALGAVRWWPVVVAGVVTVALLIYLGRSYPDGPVLLTGLVALYVLGTTRARQVAYGIAAGMAGLVVAASVATGHGAGVIDLAFVGWAGAAVFAADALRARREKARLRAEASEREERGRVVGERLRIARDLHDSVGHAMAVINLQSGMAHHVIDRRPDLAKEALGVVRAVSEGIMEELNTMVRLLRDSDEHSPLAPAPGIADLPVLMESTRQAGLDVTLDVAPTGLTGLAVARPVSVAVYRIVQESLTNVARHAGSARAWVTVTCDDGLRVEITDDGPVTAGGHEAGGSGVGITGMRERAQATGGSLSAGYLPGGGFQVVAHWPARAVGAVR